MARDVKHKPALKAHLASANRIPYCASLYPLAHGGNNTALCIAHECARKIPRHGAQCVSLAERSSRTLRTVTISAKERLVVLLRPTVSRPTHLAQAIEDLKRQHNAVILAHYYQLPEIQDMADYIGDSLQLARQAAETDADTIVFCGVHFMAETAKILSPHKTVLLPDLEAGCSLATSAPAAEFRAFVEAHPDHTVVTYVNSTAAVKAVSDYCVTSSNAVQVVNSIPPEQPILFAPDQYLGDWVREQTGRENMLLWQGSCEVHEVFSEQRLMDLIAEHRQAQVLVHPECPRHIRQHAHVVGSTKALLDAVRQGDPHGTFIVVTEPGIIHQMRQAAPQATFLEAPGIRSQAGSCTSCNECPHMKRNTLEKLWLCLEHQKPAIHLAPEVVERARLPIERMLSIG
ncbi:MAG: quinolinate synthase NadA [Planctomycetota bacterium]|nr:MAG: quinolinate synthase NadA [Planctomycetota bacterium]